LVRERKGEEQGNGGNPLFLLRVKGKRSYPRYAVDNFMKQDMAGGQKVE